MIVGVAGGFRPLPGDECRLGVVNLCALSIERRWVKLRNADI